jgi:hypothetical protein
MPLPIQPRQPPCSPDVWVHLALKNPRVCDSKPVSLSSPYTPLLLLYSSTSFQTHVSLTCPTPQVDPIPHAMLLISIHALSFVVPEFYIYDLPFKISPLVPLVWSNKSMLSGVAAFPSFHMD